jgi:hypothetical protein
MLLAGTPHVGKRSTGSGDGAGSSRECRGTVRAWNHHPRTGIPRYNYDGWGRFDGSAGWLAVPIQIPASIDPGRTTFGVEAEVEDQDGLTVHVLLHVLDEALKELEIFREDSGPLRRTLAPEELRLIVL